MLIVNNLVGFGAGATSSAPIIGTTWDTGNKGPDITLADSNYRANVGAASVWNSARTAAVLTNGVGKYYFEVIFTTTGSGIVLQDTQFMVGFCDSNFSPNTHQYMGSANNSIGVYRFSAAAYISGSFSQGTGYGENTQLPLTQGPSVVGFAVDMTTKKAFARAPDSATWQDGDPVSDQSDFFCSWSHSNDIYFGISLYSGPSDTNKPSIYLNSSGPFDYSVPSGFTAGFPA